MISDFGSARVSRRYALKASAALAAPLVVPATVLGKDGPPPSERVQVGFIGLGGRCRGIAKSCQGVPELQVAGVCDIFQPRIAAMLKQLGEGSGAQGYADFRKMIEELKLDAVMIETTTHARAWVTCHALALGCDAYIEKPMCLSISEGRAMVDCARKHNRVTQVGTQQRSIPLNNFASDLVKNGAIGKVHTVLAPNFVGPVRYKSQPAQPMPDGGSSDWWDIWTNQAEFRPYHADLQYGWNRWWAYDSGGRCYGVTGWGAHSYDQIQRGLGTDETGPSEITLMEPVREEDCGKWDPRKPTDDETGAKYYRMAKNVIGPRGKVRMRYANGTELRLELDADWGPGLGCIFIGDKGKIEVNRDKVAANPKSLLTGPDNPGPLKVNENVPHIQNWIDCIKTRNTCNADIEYGQRANAICELVNIVREVGRVNVPLKWDPKTEQFTNSASANKLLSRERRKGYELPS
jgi:predicted dehydrogenase